MTVSRWDRETQAVEDAKAFAHEGEHRVRHGAQIVWPR